MKRNMILIALAVLAAPIVFRALWFYQGIYRPIKPISTPAYEDIKMPAPAITPQPDNLTEAGNKKGDTQVLFDQSHTNEYTLSEIEPLVDQLNKIGVKIEINYDFSQLGEQLKSSDSYVIISPTINHTRDEINLLIDFISRGGKLLVIADPTRGEIDLSADYYDYSYSGLSSVDMANLVLEPFNIQFKSDYVYNLVENESNFRNIICTTMAANSPITKGLKKVVLYSAHSLQTSQSILLQGDENTLSSTTDEGRSLILGATSDNGRVLALGDVTFMTAPYNQVANNSTLVSNIATFLGGEKRARTLADFPYVFSNQVVFLTDNDEPLNKETLQDFARIQSNLKRLGLRSKVYPRPISGSDLLVIGTFGQYEKLDDYLEPFNLEFSDTITVADDRLEGTPVETTATVDAEMEELLNGYLDDFTDELTVKQITVPGFDKIEAKDMGLILLDSSNARSTLVLLADSDTQLSTLADFVAYGDLSDCAVQDNIAICPLASNGAGTDFSYPDYDYNDYLAPTPEEIMEMTPTPEAVG